MLQCELPTAALQLGDLVRKRLGPSGLVRCECRLAPRLAFVSLAQQNALAQAVLPAELHRALLPVGDQPHYRELELPAERAPSPHRPPPPAVSVPPRLGVDFDPGSRFGVQSNPGPRLGCLATRRKLSL